MKRFAVVTALAAVLLVMFAPAALAADGRETSEVVFAVNGPVDIPPGESLETLVVIDGNASISGEVETIVIAGGTATLSNATVGNVLVLDATVDLAAGTTVTGDVRTLDGTVTQQPGAVVRGTVSSVGAELAELALLLVPAMILLFLGLGIAAIAAALALATFAARQTREIESLISAEPGKVLATGIIGVVVVPLIAILAMVTVVGAPIGFTVLFILLPAGAFVSWIVAAIWVGDWLVARIRGTREPDRPYRAAVVGVLALAFAGLLPFVTAIATLFGFGALLVTGWRTLRRSQPPVGDANLLQPAPSAG